MTGPNKAAAPDIRKALEDLVEAAEAAYKFADPMCHPGCYCAFGRLQKSAAAAREAIAPPPPPAEPEVCVWRPTPDGLYDAGCRRVWFGAAPEKCGCGKPVCVKS